MSYDSRVDTSEHIRTVQEYLGRALRILTRRMAQHDLSKLVSPEKEIFDEFTPKLAATTYGSDEYKSYLEAMRPALDHHYANNAHHPEHFGNDVSQMSLLDLLEMVCDWIAATKRHNDGNIWRSIEINQNRFGYSDELREILKHTAMELTNQMA